MNGKQLSDAAVAYAHSQGYIAAHFRAAPSRSGYTTPYSYDTKGFPDLILVGRKMVAVEVKGDGDSLRVDQRAWLAAFEVAGIGTLVLTSKLWKAGALEEFLAA